MKTMTVDSDYIEIPIGEFIHGKSMNFEVYIRISVENDSADRFIKLSKKDDQLELDRIENFQEKGITHFYIKTEEFNKYLTFESKVIAAAAQSNISNEKKLKLVRITLDVLQKKFARCNINEEDFLVASRVMENAVMVLMEIDAGTEVISTFLDTPKHLQAHSSGVSIIATLIAKKLGWSSSLALRKVAMAGLFHDIGKRDFPDKLQLSRPSLLNTTEQTLYETHPILGSEILKRSKVIPIDVVNAILQHHECIDGSGYPSGLKLGKIQPIALVVCTADEFVHRFTESAGKEKTDIERILSSMIEDMWGKFAAETLIALYDLFDLKIEERLENKMVRGGLSIT